jgi:glycosyltransferase involved in cell wall biosynthesis
MLPRINDRRTLPTHSRAPKETPLVTIAVPAFDRPHLLAETLRSIAAQERKVPLEVLVCDDLRLEETRRVVEGFRSDEFHYLPNPATLGAVGNWNRCLKMARGKWVMILHEDDVLYPWFLESVLSRLNDEIAAVCTRTSRGAVPPPMPRRDSLPRTFGYKPAYFLKSSMTPFPGVLMRRSVALRLGGFDENWGPIADYEFWYRLACAGRIEVVRTVGAFYRVAPGQWTERTWARMLGLSHLLRLKIAHEQFPNSPRASRWLARFFTLGNAQCYARRFGRGPAVLERCMRFGGGLRGLMPGGWAWAALKFASRSGERHAWAVPDARRAPQIQQTG